MHFAPQAAVLASPSGSAQTTRCSTVQRDCLAGARALAGSESPQTMLGAVARILAGSKTERGGFEPPGPVARPNGFRDRRIQPALPPLRMARLDGSLCTRPSSASGIVADSLNNCTRDLCSPAPAASLRSAVHRWAS